MRSFRYRSKLAPSVPKALNRFFLADDVPLGVVVELEEEALFVRELFEDDAREEIATELDELKLKELGA